MNDRDGGFFGTNDTPLVEARVLPEWVDYNRHMNVAYYVLVFDRATDAVLDRLGLGAAYRDGEGYTVFVGEAHVTYDREVTEGETVAVRSRLLDADDKRLILFHQMTAAGGEGPVATNEVLCLNVDWRARRVAPFPPAARDRIAVAVRADRTRPRPIGAGRAIRLGARRRDAGA
jgi:acyl-CoA thioester hydrolase